MGRRAQYHRLIGFDNGYWKRQRAAVPFIIKGGNISVRNQRRPTAWQ
jgi:hypothetical protein